MTAVAMQVAHWSALVPTVGLIVNHRRGRSVPNFYWVVAAGFAVSFVADLFALNMVGEATWSVTSWYPALQLGLFGFAFGAVWIPIVTLLLAGIVPYGGGPEIVVTFVGSALVLLVSWGHRLTPAMVAYCFAGSVFYLLLSVELTTDWFMPLWYGYQVSRLFSFALFLRAAYLEDRDG